MDGARGYMGGVELALIPRHGGLHTSQAERALWAGGQRAIAASSPFQANLLALQALAAVRGGGWQGNLLHLMSSPLPSEYSVISSVGITPSAFCLALVFPAIG